MRLEGLPHAEIEPYLARDPLRNVFPLYVCAARPEQRSPAVVEDGQIRGAAVGGSEFGIPFVQADWLVADSADATRLLLANLASRGRLEGAQLAWEGAAALVGEIPGLRVVRDVYLRRPAGPAPELPAHGEMVQVDARVVQNLKMAPEIRAAIGNLSTLPKDARLWGLAVEGRLVALADTMVRYGDVVTIQQVFCAYSERRRGHTRALVARLLCHPSVAGTTLTWLANEENAASVGLARGLGFVDGPLFASVESANASSPAGHTPIPS